MGKKNRRKVGARRYGDYSLETLKLAVDLVKSKSLSSYEAEKQFGIPRRTILNHCKDKHSKAVGRPNELSEEDERHIADVVEMAGKFGCPLTSLDLRIVVYNYIQKSGRNNLFNGKMPGERWARSFLKRHNFTIRATQNIKRNRAAKTTDELAAYFDNLKTSIKDIPNTNILNFDETNLSDDPGSSKTAFKRGTKHPERVLNSTKTSISIMFSVTANGECLPPYVVYKAENLWSQWCKNGPPNARYNRTKSGWFDMTCFDDWFKTIVLPWANSREGPTVIIGDNLSSHLSVEVVQLCKENDINLVFLPPNSTHLTQPLDVAFFGPMKRIWRKILLDYKVTNTKVTTLNKTHFPELLQQLMTQIHMSSPKTICSGFAACGIFPHDPSRVLGKIPTITIEEAKQFDVSLLEYLEKNRKTQTQTKTNNKKLTVVAGKSVSTEDVSKFIKSNKSTTKRKANKDKNKNLQQPNSLNVICTKFINKVFSKEDNDQSKNSRKRTIKKKTLNSVRLLSGVSQHDKDNTPFSAANVHSLPICLQTKTTIKSDNTEATLISAPKPTITVLKDVKILPGPSGVNGSVRSKSSKKQQSPRGNNKPIISVGLKALNIKIIPNSKVTKIQSIKPTTHDTKEVKTKTKNIYSNKKLKHGKKIPLRYSRSSTSISDEISVHSDSSLMDISDDIDSDNYLLSRFITSSSPGVHTNDPTNGFDLTEISDIPTNKTGDSQIIDNKCEVSSEISPIHGLDILRPPNTDDCKDLGSILSDTDCAPPKSTKQSHDDLQSSEKVISGETNDETSQFEFTPSQERKDSTEISSFETNDTVLVSYYTRNAWKYYIGVVTASNNDNTFDISFYNTMRSKGELKFKKPRRLDRDTVPQESIIKVVELSKVSDKPEVFHLRNQNDANYF